MINLGDIVLKLDRAAEALRVLAEAVSKAVREAADTIRDAVPFELPEIEIPPLDSFIETIWALLSYAEDAEPVHDRDWERARQAEARIFASQRAAARARAFAREMVAEKAREALRRRKWAKRVDYWPKAWYNTHAALMKYHSRDFVEKEHGEIRALFFV